jgi:rhamnosyltransferase
VNRTGRVAVIAHFDPHDRVDGVFRDLVACVSDVCDRVTVVTTSRLPGGAMDGLPRAELVVRPNVGYDFMSYRAGLMRVPASASLRTVFLLNSSIAVLDPGKFTRTLQRVADATLESDVVGLTESRQFGWHLQSYLLAFSARAAGSEWFRSFFGSIAPKNSKLELILAYELGLSRLLQRHAVRARALFRPTVPQRLSASARWVAGGVRAGAWRSWRSANPIQFHAVPIAHEHGIAKVEVLASNPHRIDLTPLQASTDPARRAGIERMASESNTHFRRGRDGLLAPVGNDLEIDGRRVVHHSRPDAARSRIAVALHLFYADLLPEMLRRLDALMEPFDLFVTTPFEADVASIVDRASTAAENTAVVVTENRGRDVRPFLMLLRAGMLDRYAIALKIHGKKSAYSQHGDEWRRQLLADLVGNSLTARRSIRLLEDPAIGMVGSLRSFLSDPRFMGANRMRLAHLMDSLPGPGASDAEIAFYAGTMFWFRPPALTPLAKLPATLLDFEPEEGQRDGTLAHAIERAFALAARREGYRCTAVPLAGADIFAHRSHDRAVPVL